MLGKVKSIHFIGIGGIGMSGMAELLINLGYSITGSDLKESERTQHLQNIGAKIIYLDFCDNKHLLQNPSS